MELNVCVATLRALWSRCPPARSAQTREAEARRGAKVKVGDLDLQGTCRPSLGCSWSGSQSVGRRAPVIRSTGHRTTAGKRATSRNPFAESPSEPQARALPAQRPVSAQPGLFRPPTHRTPPLWPPLQDPPVHTGSLPLAGSERLPSSAPHRPGASEDEQQKTRGHRRCQRQGRPAAVGPSSPPSSLPGVELTANQLCPTTFVSGAQRGSHPCSVFFLRIKS